MDFQSWKNNANRRVLVYIRSFFLVWTAIGLLMGCLLFTQNYFAHLDLGLALTCFLFFAIAFFVSFYLLAVPFFADDEKHYLLHRSTVYLMIGAVLLLLVGSILGIVSYFELSVQLENDYIWTSYLGYVYFICTIIYSAGYLITRFIRLYLEHEQRKRVEEWKNEFQEAFGEDPYSVHESSTPAKREPFADVPDNPQEGEDLSGRLEAPGVEVIDVSSTPVEEDDKK